MGPSELYDDNSIPEVAFQERFVERFEEGSLGKPPYVVAFSQPAAMENRRTAWHSIGATDIGDKVIVM